MSRARGSSAGKTESHGSPTPASCRSPRFGDGRWAGTVLSALVLAAAGACRGAEPKRPPTCDASAAEQVALHALAGEHAAVSWDAEATGPYRTPEEYVQEDGWHDEDGQYAAMFRNGPVDVVVLTEKSLRGRLVTGGGYEALVSVRGCELLGLQMGM